MLDLTFQNPLFREAWMFPRKERFGNKGFVLVQDHCPASPAQMMQHNPCGALTPVLGCQK